jgi:hypothetical protein
VSEPPQPTQPADPAGRSDATGAADRSAPAGLPETEAAPAQPAEPPPPSQRPRRRGLETVGDMVRSLAVVGAFVLVLFVVVWWQRPEGAREQVVRPVDVPGVFAAAAPTAGFRLLEPAGLTDGWRPTSAWVEGVLTSDVGGVVVHAGYLTPTGSYAEVRQTDGEPGLALKQWLDGGRPTGRSVIGGTAWQTWESPTQRALVRQQGGVIRVVTGKAGWDELGELAASLVPVPEVQPSSSASSSASG